MQMFKAIACVGLVGTTALLAGCRTNAQGGALVGAGLGSAVGAIIGHNDNGHRGAGALIGAGVGALAGYAVGNEMDKEQRGTHYAGDPRYEPGYEERRDDERRYEEPRTERVVRVYEEAPPRERVIYRERIIYVHDDGRCCR